MKSGLRQWREIKQNRTRCARRQMATKVKPRVRVYPITTQQPVRDVSPFAITPDLQTEILKATLEFLLAYASQKRTRRVKRRPA